LLTRYIVSLAVLKHAPPLNSQLKERFVDWNVNLLTRYIISLAVLRYASPLK
jgi:hypothetical protein